MKRKICLLLCLALTLGLLSGCKLIVKDPVVDAATPAVEVNGEVITKGEINDETANYLDYMNMIYQAYGQGGVDVTDPELIASSRENIITEMIKERVLKQKAASYGVEYELNDEHALIDAATEGQVQVDEEKLNETYQTKLAEDQTKYADRAAYVTAVNSDTESYYVPGDIRMVKQILIRFTDEQVQQLQGLAADKKETEGKIQALKDAAETEAPAAETEAPAAETEAPAAETEAPAAETEAPAAETEAPAEETAVPAEPEETLQSLELKLKELESQYQIALAAACEGIQEETDQVMEELRNGGDWDAISADHNDDPGMMAGRKTAETGYAVYEGFEDFDAAFMQAALSLQNPGEIADPAAGVHGYYIVRLERDLTEGAVPFEELHDALYKKAYDQQASELYDTLVEQWVSEATVVRHDEVFK